MLTQPTNFGVVILASGGINSSQTSFALATGYGAALPDPATKGPSWLTLFDWTTHKVAWKDPYHEIIKITAKSVDTISSCVRGQQGTAAVAHNTVGKTYYGVLGLTAFDAIEIPFLVVDILNGTTNYKRTTILGVNASTIYHPAWENNPDANPANPYSQPIGSLYIAEKGDGYVDIRANADQGNVDRRIVLTVQRVAS